MTTPAVQSSGNGRHMLSIVRMLVTGAIASALIFVLCWIGNFVPYSSPTHAFIGLFTNADINSGRALFEGSVWSLLFGGLAAALFALVYNNAAAIGHR